MIEHEQPNGGGEIPPVTPAINVGDHIRQRLMTPRGNFLHAFPEGILETDAGLVPGYYDRAFDDRRFHRPSSLACAVRVEARVAGSGTLVSRAIRGERHVFTAWQNAECERRYVMRVGLTRCGT